MKIFIKNINGITTDVECEEMDTIRSIKYKYMEAAAKHEGEVKTPIHHDFFSSHAERVGVAPIVMELVYNSRLLDEKKTLQDYAIKDKSLILEIRRMPAEEAKEKILQDNKEAKFHRRF